MMLQFGLGGNWSVRLDGKIAPVSAAQISQSEISGGVSLIRLLPKRGNGWEFRGEGGRMLFVTKDGTRLEQNTLLVSVGYIF